MQQNYQRIQVGIGNRSCLAKGISMSNSTQIQKPPIGISDFKELRENGFYFVDKTDAIRETVDTASKILLLPRLRRFGKTLNLSMLRYFFEKAVGDNRDLFRGLAISQTECFEEHLGRYPVIYQHSKTSKALHGGIPTKSLSGKAPMKSKGILLFWRATLFRIEIAA